MFDSSAGCCTTAVVALRGTHRGFKCSWYAAFALVVIFVYLAGLSYYHSRAPQTLRFTSNTGFQPTLAQRVAAASAVLAQQQAGDASAQQAAGATLQAAAHSGSGSITPATINGGSFARRMGQAAHVGPDPLPTGRGSMARLGDELASELRGLAASFKGGQRLPTREDVMKLQATLPPVNRTLRFQVCNGFANQRLSVVYGILVAQRLGRSPVLPVLISDGTQMTDTAVYATAANQVPFDQVYNKLWLQWSMAQSGVHVLDEAEAPSPLNYQEVDITKMGWEILVPLNTTYADVPHLTIGCPLFKLMSHHVLDRHSEELIWAVLDGLKPTEQADKMIDRMAAAILKAGKAADPKGPAPTKFNFLHLRMEDDWVEHCRRWGSIKDGLVRDNCYNHTEEVDVQLVLFGISNQQPLYVGAYWENVQPQRMKQVMARIAAAGYKVVTSADVFPPQVASANREFRALLEYYLSMRASRFMGNSVSTFSGLAMLERRRHSLWASYYNGGNIPLIETMPVLHKLPWVFTYNSWSKPYDYMLKGALRSALAHGSLKPYCIFLGNSSSFIYHWLADHGVTMISHIPKWKDILVEKAHAHLADNIQHSHLYKSPDMLVSTFQRVDLPVVPILDQYTYVLYTDADVFFRGPVRLKDFGLPLPRSVAMSFEFVNVFPYNAGIMLINLPYMRRTYNAFISAMLDNNEGMFYPNYGPGDQGILNKFYERDLRLHVLSQNFNEKPYHDFNPHALIVHFHGPKPHEYINFIKDGHCDFYYVCEEGFLRGLCQYTSEWQKYLEDEPVPERLSDACSWLTNPTIVGVLKKKWGLVDKQAIVIPEDKLREFVHADHFRSGEDHEASTTAAAIASALHSRKAKEQRRAVEMVQAAARAAAKAKAMREREEQDKQGDQGDDDDVGDDDDGKGAAVPTADAAERDNGGDEVAQAGGGGVGGQGVASGVVPKAGGAANGGTVAGSAASGSATSAAAAGAQLQVSGQKQKQGVGMARAGEEH